MTAHMCYRFGQHQNKQTKPLELYKMHTSTMYNERIGKTLKINENSLLCKNTKLLYINQKGIRATFQSNHYFLPCVTKDP